MTTAMDLNNEWAEYSTLTVYEAAFMLAIGADPKAHSARCECDTRYAEYFDERTDAHELITEKCLILESAIVAEDGIDAMQIVRSRAGLLNFRDTIITKRSFLKWCENKPKYAFVLTAFKTADRGLSTTIESVSDQNSNNPNTDWRDEARRFADECFDHDTLIGCRDSLSSYAARVMDKLQDAGIHGPRGLINNPSTIQREALQGDRWWRKKKK